MTEQHEGIFGKNELENDFDGGNLHCDVRKDFNEELTGLSRKDGKHVCLVA